MRTQDRIEALFDDWSDALHAGDVEAVLACYAPDAVLLPTFSDRVRRTPAELHDYFAPLAARRPRATVDDATVRLFDCVAIRSGLYTFHFESGPLRAARARFTFVYRRDEHGWRIVEHHSSAMPEASVAAKATASAPSAAATPARRRAEA